MILGFAGKGQTGKTTAADILVEERGFRKISFASGVKEECTAFLEKLGILFETRHFYGTKEDKEELITCFNRAEVLAELPEFLDFVNRCNCTDLSCTMFEFTPRSMMQWWGTDYRRRQDVHYWVDRAMTRAAMLSQEGFNVAIDDVRFPGEVEAVQDAGGFVCYVIRHDRPVIAGAQHESETSLDGYAGFDKYIVNDSSIPEYRDKLLTWWSFLSHPFH